MSIDISDLIDPLKREINQPGGDLYPNADDDTFVGYLEDGFWEAYLDGLLTDFIVDGNGIITNRTTGGTDIPREFQQIIVIYAGMKVVRTALQNNQTAFSAKAGPVEFATETSANVYRDLLAELRNRRDRLIQYLSTRGILQVHYIDGVDARLYGGPPWVN